MAYSLFLSHCADDTTIVGEIQRRSACVGITVYAFEHDVRAGTNLASKLIEAVRQADGVVAVLTQRGMQRPAVQQEIGAAVALGKPVFALIERGVDTTALALLQGIEYVSLDPDDLTSAMRSLQESVIKHRRGVELGLFVVALIVAFLTVLALRGE